MSLTSLRRCLPRSVTLENINRSIIYHSGFYSSAVPGCAFKVKIFVQRKQEPSWKGILLLPTTHLLTMAMPTRAPIELWTNNSQDWHTVIQSLSILTYETHPLIHNIQLPQGIPRPFPGQIAAFISYTVLRQPHFYCFPTPS